MIENLFSFDQNLFYLINRGWTHVAFDQVLPLFRNKYFWTPLYIFIFSFLLINFKRKGIWLIVLIIITVALTDQISSSFLKNWVGRLRPCRDQNFVEYVRLLVNCSKSFSFPSSHAANHFSLAFFLIVAFGKQWRWLFPALFLWAFSISYAQVYVGVHYPLDIFGGMVLGIAIGSAVGIVAQRIFLRDH